MNPLPQSSSRSFPVSERTLLGRIRYVLALEGKTLRRNSPDTRAYERMGRYSILECKQACGPFVVSLEDLGRDLNVLRWDEFLRD